MIEDELKEIYGKDIVVVDINEGSGYVICAKPLNDFSLISFQISIKDLKNPYALRLVTKNGQHDYPASRDMIKKGLNSKWLAKKKKEKKIGK